VADINIGYEDIVNTQVGNGYVPSFLLFLADSYIGLTAQFFTGFYSVYL